MSRAVTRALRLVASLAVACLGVALSAGLVVLAAPAPAGAAPECPAVTVEQSTKAARAVFSGTVTAVERQARDDGQRGAVYLQTVEVSRVYQGRVTSETVQVQTDRNLQQCSLGELATGTSYMFFAGGTGDPYWTASGASGTRPDDATTTAAVVQVLGEGSPPVEPTPADAEFTPVDTSEPRSLSRTAAPGAAAVLVGLLGFALVAGLNRRRA